MKNEELVHLYLLFANDNADTWQRESFLIKYPIIQTHLLNLNLLFCHFNVLNKENLKKFLRSVI